MRQKQLHLWSPSETETLLISSILLNVSIRSDARCFYALNLFFLSSLAHLEELNLHKQLFKSHQSAQYMFSAHSWCVHWLISSQSAWPLAAVGGKKKIMNQCLRTLWHCGADRQTVYVEWMSAVSQLVKQFVLSALWTQVATAHVSLSVRIPA